MVHAVLIYFNQLWITSGSSISSVFPSKRQTRKGTFSMFHRKTLKHHLNIWGFPWITQQIGNLRCECRTEKYRMSMYSRSRLNKVAGFAEKKGLGQVSSMCWDGFIPKIAILCRFSGPELELDLGCCMMFNTWKWDSSDHRVMWVLDLGWFHALRSPVLEGMDSFNSFNDPQGSGETTHSCPDTLHMLCQVFHGFSKAKEGELKDVGKIRLLRTESIRKVFRGDKSLVALLRAVCQISSSTHLFWSTLCQDGVLGPGAVAIVQRCWWNL